MNIDEARAWLDNAESDIGSAHAEFCIAADNCDCRARQAATAEVEEAIRADERSRIATGLATERDKYQANWDRWWFDDILATVVIPPAALPVDPLVTWTEMNLRESVTVPCEDCGGKGSGCRCEKEGQA